MSRLTTDATFIGLDFGTSGARAIAITCDRTVVCRVSEPYLSADTLPACWSKALWTLLTAIPRDIRQRCQAIAIDGTSGTVLLCDRNGTPITEPLLYNQAVTGVTLPTWVTGPARSPTSSLAKALWWQQTLSPQVQATVGSLLHQADWLGWLLHGQLGVSDYHNALKLGYDVTQLQYPDRLQSLAIMPWLPEVQVPGETVAPVQPQVIAQFHFPKTCQVKAGTTDSIAAFLASGARQPGEAVTSLGSTLVLKLLSRQPVVDAAAGVYSHRLGDLWLAGGASNTGGAVLRHFFSDADLVSLSARLNPDQPTGFDYYPLLTSGERFPINDPAYPPRLTPRPKDAAQFLQGLLEGMARIEAQGYQKLMTLGSSPVHHVYTAGGGANNTAWTMLRHQVLGVPVTPSPNADAAFGTALLAMGA